MKKSYVFFDCYESLVTFVIGLFSCNENLQSKVGLTKDKYVRMKCCSCARFIIDFRLNVQS